MLRLPAWAQPKSIAPECELGVIDQVFEKQSENGNFFSFILQTTKHRRQVYISERTKFEKMLNGTRSPVSFDDLFCGKYAVIRAGTMMHSFHQKYNPNLVLNSFEVAKSVLLLEPNTKL